MTTSGTRSHWSHLLRIGRALIRQANSTGFAIEDWTLGGGTALMLHIQHRESRDIDIFLRDPQHLALLNPETHDFHFETRPSAHMSDGASFLKLVFENVGEIDFIVAGALTSTPSAEATVEGEPLLLETVPEIIVKKIYHRGSSIKPRDIFDIAASAESHAATIESELERYKDNVAATISALERLNPDFVRQSILQLAIKSGYETIAKSARERALEILRTVSP